MNEVDIMYCIGLVSWYSDIVIGSISVVMCLG